MEKSAGCVRLGRFRSFSAWSRASRRETTKSREFIGVIGVSSDVSSETWPSVWGEREIERERERERESR